MTRELKKEQKAFDTALGHFDSIDDFVYAINTQLKRAKIAAISRQAVMSWYDNGIPDKRIIAIERATGGAVTRQQLRPDLYS